MWKMGTFNIIYNDPCPDHRHLGTTESLLPCWAGGDWWLRRHLSWRSQPAVGNPPPSPDVPNIERAGWQCILHIYIYNYMIITQPTRNILVLVNVACISHEIPIPFPLKKQKYLLDINKSTRFLLPQTHLRKGFQVFRDADSVLQQLDTLQHLRQLPSEANYEIDAPVSLIHRF